jgi:HD-GYP domain-containing protein (c-di-GMP phosphodiesterase class II)
MGTGPDQARLCMAEALAAMSLAIDLGMGQPLEQGLRTCAIATGLARRYGLDDDLTTDVFDLALIRHIGCTAGSDLTAELLGDEVRFHAGALTLQTTPKEMLPFLVRNVGAGDAPLRRVRRVATALAKSKDFLAASNEVCEVGSMLASRLGLPAAVREGVRQVFERHDGKGIPDGRRGEDITLAARFIRIAEMTEATARLGGTEAARRVARDGSGSAFDPDVARCFDDAADELIEAARRPTIWDDVVGGRPRPGELLDGDHTDALFEVMADFTDQKSLFTLGHSRGVAALASDAGEAAGLGPDDVTVLRRAALAHDVGRVGISTGVWSRTAPLDHDDWERIRLHPYYTERALARPAGIAPIGALAACHHERVDGSGYHRSVPAAVLSTSARILAVADTYHAMTEPRPHRPALGPDEAARRVRDDVRAGRLDGDAAETVLRAAGHRPRVRQRTNVAGLTGREVEVLRSAAAGGSIKSIAADLSIAPKTVDAHLQHIYTKLGVTTRAGAVVFALDAGLLGSSTER